MIERYNVAEHYETVNKWFIDQKGHQIPLDLLSNIGFIAPNTAAGFLITTNTGVCFTEPYIANPRADKHERDLALTAIMSHIEDEARKLGFKYLYGIATAPTMIDRAVKRDWYDMGSHTVVVKRL